MLVLNVIASNLDMKLFSVTIGAMFLLAGAVGIFLPLVPGLVLVAVGISILSNNKTKI